MNQQPPQWQPTQPPYGSPPHGQPQWGAQVPQYNGQSQPSNSGWLPPSNFLPPQQAPWAPQYQFQPLWLQQPPPIKQRRPKGLLIFLLVMLPCVTFASIAFIVYTLSVSSQIKTPLSTPHYQSVSKETVLHFLSPTDTSSGTAGYLQLQSDSNLYIINESDFTPPVNGNSFGDGDVISFVYRTDQTTSIDQMASNNNTHLQGNAYTIVQLTVFDSNGQNPKVYTSSQYTH